MSFSHPPLFFLFPGSPYSFPFPASLSYLTAKLPLFAPQSSVLPSDRPRKTISQLCGAICQARPTCIMGSPQRLWGISFPPPHIIYPFPPPGNLHILSLLSPAIHQPTF